MKTYCSLYFVQHDSAFQFHILSTLVARMSWIWVYILEWGQYFSFGMSIEHVSYEMSLHIFDRFLISNQYPVNLSF